MGCGPSADLSLAQTAFALAQSKLWLPGSHSALDVKVVPLNKTARLGLVHRDITGPRPRGPFEKIAPTPTATYPSLWNHDAKNETRMACQPDSQLRVRSGMEEKAAVVWATASRAHVNRDFRFNSQPLTAAFTERENMGGRAWPNVRFPDNRFDYAFTLWSNSTLGLLLYWWHSTDSTVVEAPLLSETLNHCPSLISAPSARSSCAPPRPFSTNSGI